MADKYLIQKETLTNIANKMRIITGTTDLMSLSDMSTLLNHCVHDSKTFRCYVGMMPPNNNVGSDGDVFFLV